MKLKTTKEILKELQDKSLFSTIWAFFWRYIVLIIAAYAVVFFVSLALVGFAEAL